MKITLVINGKDTEVELTSKQVESIKKTPINITDRINGWEDVAEILGIHPVNDLPFPTPKNDREEATNAFYIIDSSIDVYNEEWVPDFTDSNEEKWFPIWKGNQSGFGFSLSLTDYDITYTLVGARLCFRNDALLRDFVKKFDAHCQKLLTKKRK
jgi:hypothetical protein